MKGSHPVITILGSNSGNNLGDAAILSSMLESLSREIPGAEFLVPTTKPSFIETHYAHRYNVKAINIMPWTGSIRFLGIPTFWALMRSDCALICDGIIFGKKLLNPAFNFLIVLAFVVPFARLVGCMPVCYSCGIGPFHSWLSRVLARWTIQLCDLIMMRENDSKRLCETLGVTKPVHLTGDAAFVNPVSDDARAREILAKEGIDPQIPILGINVTSYLDGWLASNERVSDRTNFITTVAEGVREATRAMQGPCQVVAFSTHPMDLEAVEHLASLTNGKVIHNRDYLSHDIQAVMRHCQLFVGMRFHSLILASAVGAPIVALVYAPKVKGFMRLLQCEDLSMELNKIDVASLAQTIADAWSRRAEIKSRQQAVIDGIKAGARKANRMIIERYYPHLLKSQEVEAPSMTATRMAS